MRWSSKIYDQGMATNWHPWFAWRPVRLGMAYQDRTDWVWLELIEKRKYKGFIRWWNQYRLRGDKNDT